MGVLRRFHHDQRGATAVEYIVAVILCCMVVGGTIREKFEAGQAEISNMEEAGAQPRDRKSASRGAGASGASGADGAGGASVASSSGSQDSESGGGGGGAGGEGDTVEVVDKGNKTKRVRDAGGLVTGFEEEKKAGFNPIVLLIILALIGVLGFVMYKGNKG